MRIQSYTCDGCLKQKVDSSDHWFVAKRTRVSFELHTWLWAEHEDALDDDPIEGVVHVHLCGQECAMRKISEWLGELNGTLLEQYRKQLQDLGEL